MTSSDDQTSGRKTIGDLLAVMAALRTPVTGCPWDLDQTFETIAPYTIEEAYEVADAIDRRDMPDLCEELGDLLLQVVYHARIADEAGTFDFADVVDGITRKMIRRHPHVFGDPAQRTGVLAPGFWERIKAEERAEKAAARAAAANKDRPSADATAEMASRSTGEPSASVLNGVPVGMPALTRAVKLQSKAAKVGFDWPSLAPVIAKLAEELSELAEAQGKGDPAQIEEEYGDLLFVVANIGRHLAVDPEAALRRANAKFERRFGRVEALLAARGRTPAQSNLAEMDGLWDIVKAEERSAKTPAGS